MGLPASNFIKRRRWECKDKVWPLTPLKKGHLIWKEEGGHNLGIKQSPLNWINWALWKLTYFSNFAAQQLKRGPGSPWLLEWGTLRVLFQFPILSVRKQTWRGWVTSSRSHKELQSRSWIRLQDFYSRSYTVLFLGGFHLQRAGRDWTL